MGLFKRRKKSCAPSAPPALGGSAIAGIPDDVVASGDFEMVVRQLIMQMSPAGTEIVDAGNDSVRAGDLTTYLGNYRKNWHTLPAGEREVWLRNALRGVFLAELRDTSTLDLTMLRPGIRSAWYLNLIELSSRVQQGMPEFQHGLASRSLGPGLVRVLLWDTPTTMSLISDAQIGEWGSDFDQLWTVAVQNLANDPGNHGWTRVSNCAMPSHTDDYTAERLFITGYVESAGLAGDVVMFHPNRETLLLVDPNNAAGVEVAAKIALSKADEANPVTPIPYIGSGLSWKPFELSNDHPASEAVTELRLKELMSTYSQQKELLSAIHGEDLFVATYMAYRTDEGVVTTASWTEGALSLLPRTDMISFTYALDAPEPQTVMVPWDVAAQVVGDRLEPTAHWPERWRVSSFPTPSEIEQLRAWS